MNIQKKIFILNENFSLLIINNVSHESLTKRCQIEYEFSINIKKHNKRLKSLKKYLLKRQFYFISILSVKFD
jgi:hypothetical protein